MRKIASVLLACAFSAAAFAQTPGPAPAPADKTRAPGRDEAKLAGQTVDTVPMAKTGPDNAARVKKTPGKKSAKKQAPAKPES